MKVTVPVALADSVLLRPKGEHHGEVLAIKDDGLVGVGDEVVYEGDGTKVRLGEEDLVVVRASDLLLKLRHRPDA